MWKHPLQWCQGVQAVRLGAQSHTAHAEPVLGCVCTQTQDEWFILCHALARLDTLFY